MCIVLVCSVLAKVWVFMNRPMCAASLRCALRRKLRTHSVHIAPHHDEVTPVKLARLAGVLLS